MGNVGPYTVDHVVAKARGGCMANDKPFRRFQWQDKTGRTWIVHFYNESWGFEGFAASEHEHGTGSIHIQTHQLSQEQSIARLAYVQVDDRIENRGMGTMLVREAVKECKRRGHRGIDGYLSSADSDHFLKLKHFYTNLGFSVVFFTEKHPDYSHDRVGKIEMVL